MKTKFIQVATFLSMFLAIPAYGQTNKHEIRANFGMGVDSHVKDVCNQYIENFDMENSSPFGLRGLQAAGTLEYFYHLNKHWAIGANLGIAESEAEARVKWGDKVKDGDTFSYVFGGIIYCLFPTSDIQIHTNSQFLMPSVKYSWIASNHFRLYTKAALGIQHYKLDAIGKSNSYPETHENNCKVAYQFSPVGIEVGGERMRGFLELGYGKQGLYNIGILVNL